VSDQFVVRIDDEEVEVMGDRTILDVCRAIGRDIPTLCYLQTLTPVNACRVCMVEVEGARVLVPACSRMLEPGMIIRTESERVNRSRRLVLELLASSVDLSLVSNETRAWMESLEVNPSRFGEPNARQTTNDRDDAVTGEHIIPAPTTVETVEQPVKVDNELYIRDYSRCILCYKCVEACGSDAQNTFAIAVAGRGFDARISTEWNVTLPDSACVYCGNCIAVCPTGALMFKTSYDLRREGLWDEEKQSVSRTVCPYCGVGCNLELRVQDNQIVEVTSPLDHDVTAGNLCIKGRFGFEYVNHSTATDPGEPIPPETPPPPE
jgi:predicted molibdopterin-dependent oxidoreductase YjgC